ncbi:hypothetical protein [Ancylobacter sp.]|uniref:hypothetical protein n=1 Tax=Ancylobacter sp. TaxID=1872567 RepID=UPI003C7ABC14
MARPPSSIIRARLPAKASRSIAPGRGVSGAAASGAGLDGEGFEGEGFEGEGSAWEGGAAASGALGAGAGVGAAGATFTGRARGAVAGAGGSAARGTGAFLLADLRPGMEAAGDSTATSGCAGLFAADFFNATSGADAFGAAAGAATVGCGAAAALVTRVRAAGFGGVAGASVGAVRCASLVFAGADFAGADGIDLLRRLLTACPRGLVRS